MKWALCPLLLVVFAACEYGKDDPINWLPDIVIENVTATGKLPSQVYVGETLRIAPDITYGNEGAEAFNFKWYKQSTNSLKLLSEEHELVQVMDSLGYWTIRLEVTNKQTQVTEASTMVVNVVSHNERGWYVLKETAEGNTDMDLFRINLDAKDPQNPSGEKVASDGEKSENILAAAGTPLTGKPVALLYSWNYQWKEEWESSFTAYSTFIPVSENDMAAFRINNGSVMTKTDGMFYNHSDRLSNPKGGISVASQNALLNGDGMYLMSAGMQAFLPRVPGNYKLSPWLTCSQENMSTNQTSNILAFDEQSHSFVSISPLASNMRKFSNKYLPEAFKISANNMNGTISFMQNTNGSLNDSLPSYGQRAYALFHETGRTDRCIVLGLDLAQVDQSQSKHGAFAYSPVMWADTLDYSKAPALETATLMALHKEYPLIFFVNGNQIGTYYIATQDYKENFITLPAGEEVTYMHYLDITYDDAATYQNCLVVATYAQATGEYKIYRYRINGNDVHQEGTVYSGKGKVKSLMFATPTTAKWQYQLYRYY